MNEADHIIVRVTDPQQRPPCLTQEGLSHSPSVGDGARQEEGVGGGNTGGRAEGRGEAKEGLECT